MRAALFGAMVVTLLGAAATTYVRTRTTSGGHCLHWPAGPVQLVQSEQGLADLGDAGFDAVARAWHTWEAQMQVCGDLVLSEGARSASRTIGYRPDAGAPNQNLVLFRTVSCADVIPPSDPCLSSGSCANQYDCWDHAAGTVALTTVSYLVASGVLVDADVEFNASDYLFTTVDSPPCPASAEALTCVADDVQNTATHELGHFLGLDHSPDPSSTMYASAPIGETSKRVLDPGSLQFVCDVYPGGRPSQDCLAPDGGTFSGSLTGGCSTAGSGPGWAPLLALVGLAARRRRR